MQSGKKCHKYGWKPDIADQRDFKYSKPFRLFLPKEIDLRDNCSTVEDQGSLGSCTANALAGNLELLEKKNFGQYVDVSRLFIYFNERSMEGTIDQDAGAYIRDGIKSLAKWGVCDESMWPYNIDTFTQKPTPNCYTQAKQHIITKYERLNGVSDMLGCLASGSPIVFGISVYESFESDLVSKTGYVPMPDTDERMLGGHAVCAVGYKMNDKRFIVRNSWGSGWGDNGYFYLPFQYVDKLADDFWTIHK